MRAIVGALALAFVVAQLVFFGALALARVHTETSIMVKVDGVYDGDTFSIHLGGLPDKVRLLGIDAPELRQGRWGKEAQVKLSTLVTGKTVRIEVDEKKPRDAYGRLLGYVYIGDTMVQKELLLGGLAIAKAYGEPPRLYDVMWMLSERARTQRVGLWGDPTFVPPDAWRKQQGIGR